MAVAVGQDPTVLQAVAEAARRNIAQAVLVGDAEEIGKAAAVAGVSLEVPVYSARAPGPFSGHPR